MLSGMTLAGMTTGSGNHTEMMSYENMPNVAVTLTKRISQI